MKFSLRFNKNRIRRIAEAYEYPKEDYIINTVAPRTKANGYFTRNDFLAICEWKTPRVRSRREKNDSELIKEITSIALTTKSERLRIEILTLLDGVNYPTASVILHWCHKKPYPILDFRALWSLGYDKPPKYDFKFWWEYTQYCRKLAKECKVSMRVLDRALWQYSKENQ